MRRGRATSRARARCAASGTQCRAAHAAATGPSDRGIGSRPRGGAARRTSEPTARDARRAPHREERATRPGRIDAGRRGREARAAGNQKDRRAACGGREGRGRAAGRVVGQESRESGKAGSREWGVGNRMKPAAQAMRLPTQLLSDSLFPIPDSQRQLRATPSRTGSRAGQPPAIALYKAMAPVTERVRPSANASCACSWVRSASSTSNRSAAPAS